MDLKSLSDEDLIALSTGKLDNLSDGALLFLAGKGEKTSFGEDLGIALNSAAQPVVKTAGLLSGGLAGLVGATDTRDSIFKGMEDVSKNMEDYWVPKDKEQTFGGKVGAAVATLPMQMAAMPFSSGGTAVDLTKNGESLGTALAGTAIDTVGNVAGLLFNPLGKTMGARVLTGAGMNAAQDVATKKMIQGIADTEATKQQYEPTKEDTAIAALIGGGFGAIHKPATQDAVPKPKVEPPPEIDKRAKTEQQILDVSLAQIDRELSAVKDYIVSTDMSTMPIDEKSAQLNFYNQRYDKLIDQKANLLAKSDDPIAIAAMKDKITTELHDRSIESLKAKETPELPDHLKNELPPLPDELPPEPREKVITEVKEPIKRVENLEKTAPFEVALNKIEEAKAQTQEEVKIKLAEAINKYENTPEERTALKESLSDEIKAYYEILNGKEPDTASTPSLNQEVRLREVQPTEGITIPEVVTKYTTLTDLTTAHNKDEPAIIAAIKDNPTLVKENGFDPYFDTTPIGKGTEKILSHFLNITGLDSEKVFVIHDPNLTSFGRASAHGDTLMIQLNMDKMYKPVDALKGWESVKAIGLVGKHLDNAMQTFMAVRVGAHEVGHLLLAKYLKNTIDNTKQFNKLLFDFNSYKKANPLENVSFFDAYRENAPAKYRKKQEMFHEFFAEQVAKQLIYKHTMGAFSKGISKPFSKLIDASSSYLKENGMSVDKPNFATQIADSIIANNQQLIKATGEGVWSRMERETTDRLLTDPQKPLFYDNNLQEVINYSKQHGMLSSDPMVGLDMNDFATMSSKAVDLLASGRIKISKNFYGKERLAEFNEREPFVHNAALEIRKAEEKADYVKNHLLNGEVHNENLSKWQTLTKQKNPDSPATVLHEMSDMDAYSLLREFQGGLDVPYKETLEKSALKQKQRHYFEVMSQLFHDLGAVTVGIEDSLQKKHLMSIREGWFPAARVGRYAITVGFGDIVSDRYHYPTQLAAEKALAKLKELGYSDKVSISNVIDTKKEAVQTNAQMADILAKNLKDSGFFTVPAKIQRIVDSMNERGGKMGKHHEFRQGVGGYLGDMPFMSAAEQGKAFKDAILYSIEEKGNQVKQMIIDTKVKSILDKSGLMERYPQSKAVIQQMYDSALGRNIDYASNFTDHLHHSANKIIDNLANVLGIEYKAQGNALKEGFGVATQLFFYTKMIPSITFSIIGQYASMPATAIARGAEGGHSLQMYKSFASGMIKLAAGDQALWTAIKEDSQKYNVFSASFIEAMDIKKSTNPLVNFAKDYLLLQAPAQRSDSGSRVLSYAVMYEHGKALGMKEDVARAYARKETDAIIGVYDKANAAPIFSKLGFVGDLMKPLVGFGQNQQGVLFHTIQQMSAKDYKTWGPFINYMLINTALVGLIGLPFAQEYEMIRKWAAEKFDDVSLPSLLDFAANQADFISRVTPINEEEVAKILYLGGPAAELFGGIDWAKSSRSNLSFLTIAAGVVASRFTGENGVEVKQVFPVADWAMGLPGDAVTVGKYAAGMGTTGDAKKAAENILPVGHLGYLGKEVLGLNTTKVGGEHTNLMPIGKEGQANRERTDQDIFAGMMGTKTTSQRFDDQINLELEAANKLKNDKKERAAIRVTENDDPKALQQLINLGMTPKQIIERVGTETYNRTVDKQTRLMTSKKGKMSQTNKENAVRIFNFKDSE